MCNIILDMKGITVMQRVGDSQLLNCVWRSTAGSKDDDGDHGQHHVKQFACRPASAASSSPASRAILHSHLLGDAGFRSFRAVA